MPKKKKCFSSQTKSVGYSLVPTIYTAPYMIKISEDCKLKAFKINFKSLKSKQRFKGRSIKMDAYN